MDFGKYIIYTGGSSMLLIIRRVFILWITTVQEVRSKSPNVNKEYSRFSSRSQRETLKNWKNEKGSTSYCYNSFPNSGNGISKRLSPYISICFYQFFKSVLKLLNGLSILKVILTNFDTASS